MTDEEIIALFDRCSNTGRWGPEDELGTLNYITDAKRLAAAALVRHGRSVSLGRDLSTVADRLNADPIRHRMLFDATSPVSALDSFEMATHGFAVTHLDAITHVFWRGNAYNGRRSDELLRPGGLRSGSVFAQREGIVTRGVLLDVTAVRGVQYLTPGDAVTADDLTAAERLSGTTVTTGDAVFVHVGLERREAEQGTEDPAVRAGLDASCLPWLHEREVAVYSGDCIEQIPFPSEAVPLPLHQIGLVAMGLVLTQGSAPATSAGRARVASCDGHIRSPVLIKRRRGVGSSVAGVPADAGAFAALSGKDVGRALAFRQRR